MRVTLHNIVFRPESGLELKGRDLGLTIEGHAAFAAKGSDVVCAGVSAVALSCVAAIERVARLPVKVEQRDGYLEACFSAEGADGEQRTMLAAILGMMMIGLSEISASSPQSIDIMYT